jgi:hypothetical protein
MTQTQHNEGTFNGFVPPVSNYFRMPIEWINICAKIDSLAELKIVQYVLRHTWGYQEYDGTLKTITTEEFMHGRKRSDGSRIDDGTGLSDRGVKNGIALAIEHGYLVCEVDDSDKARVKKSYGLKIFSDKTDGNNLPTQQKQIGTIFLSDRNNLPTDGNNLPIKGEQSSYRSEKDTKERYLKKNTLERKKEPTAKSTEDSFSHSSTPQSSFEKSSFSSETKAEEETVTLSPKEQQVYELGSQTIFKVKPPKVTSTVKGYCAEIAKAGVTTLDKMESLVTFTKQEKHLVGKTLYLGNLVNALNGWLLSQQQPSQREHTMTRKGSPTATPPMSKEERDTISKRNLDKLKADIAEREANEKVAQ